MAKLLYGVFSVQRCWKLHMGDAETRTFVSRQSAVAAAESATRLALAHDIDVELYLENEQGRFEKVAPASIAH